MRKIVPLVAAVLAGCSTPGYRESQVPVPSSYGTATPVATTTRPAPLITQSSAQPVYVSATSATTPFWSDLGDTTLTMLIREAERANMDVRIAESRLTRARASRRLSSFDLVPTITGTSSSLRAQQSIAQIPGLTQQFPAQQLWDVGFDASWELDIFGRVGRTVRAQSALVESSEHGLADLQISVAAEVARTYFELRGAQRQLAVSLGNATNQREIVQLTENLLSAGRGTAFDTERAKSVLYLTLAVTPALESQIALDRNRIAVLLGRTPEALPAALVDSGALPRLPDTLRVGSPDQLVRRRPDVLRAERLLAASALFVGAARAEYLPRITLGARAGYTGTSVDSLFRSGNSRLLIGPVMTFPLFDIGRVRERVGIARAGQEEAQAEYNSTVLRALEESEGSLVTYDRAHARLAILADAVRSSERAAALAKQRFEAGLTDLLQVLDAERTLLDAQNQFAAGNTAAATALVAVYKAVGGTWPMR